METSFTHNGHTVSLRSDFMFDVFGPAFENLRGYGETYFASADDAKRKIDDRVKAVEAQTRTRERVAIDAVDDQGKPCVIRGINANTSKLMGAPKSTVHRSSASMIFPPVPWLIAEIQRWQKLRKEMAAIYHKISEYGLYGSRGYGRVSPEKYDALMSAFIDEFETNKKKAEANAPSEPVP